MGALASLGNPVLGNPINCYALVSYIPGSLGLFLNDLRRELVPGCSFRSHVTLLPPRGLSVSAHDAWENIQHICSAHQPFRVDLVDIEVFPGTQVIYAALGEGFAQLDRIHTEFMAGPLRFDEPFAYHPHVTLAQSFPAENFDHIAALARRRWRDYRGEKHFLVENLAFVQNTDTNEWLDLQRLDLIAPHDPPSYRQAAAAIRTS